MTYDRKKQKKEIDMARFLQKDFYKFYQTGNRISIIIREMVFYKEIEKDSGRISRR